MTSFKSYFIDRAAAEKAVRLVLPMMAEAVESREAGASGFLYIVVMRPGVDPARTSFEEAILYEHALGDTAKWDADYGAYARGKAKVAWKTGMDTHVAAQMQPHRLEAGDSLLAGGVVVDGIVVAVSGADPWYDELFAGTVARCLIALAKSGAVTARESGPYLSASARPA